MESSIPSFRNPLKFIIGTTIFILSILFLVYVGLRTAIAYDNEYKRVELLRDTANDIKLISLSVFEFVRPFLQLVLILIILEWLLNKFGLSINMGLTKLDWSVQTVIALVIMIAFALAALSGIQGAGMLKDVALVVVGFYFGTQKKTNEIVDADKRHTIIEEHTNERGKEEQK